VALSAQTGWPGIVLDESVIRLDVLEYVSLEWARIFSALVVYEDAQTLVIAAARPEDAIVPARELGATRGKKVELRIAVDITLARTIRVAFAKWKTGELFLAGPEAERSVASPPASRVVLLENLRFHPEEEKNDAGFAKSLAALADVYVNDAFGAAHRAHASVEAMVRLFREAGAGLLMEKELRYLGEVLGHPEHPFVAVLGGAKVSDKIEVIQNLIPRVDRLLIGGAMAYTFFKAMGKPVGKSLVEDDKLDAAKDILAGAKERGLQLLLPVDHVVAEKLEAGVPSETLSVDDAAIGSRMGLDIGPETGKAYARALAEAKTVVWNGPMGVFEIDAFAKGTLAVANAVAAVKGTTIIGGGDSIAAITKAGVADRVTHISTGGGASLEFLGGRTLPGVAVLPDA